MVGKKRILIDKNKKGDETQYIVSSPQGIKNFHLISVNHFHSWNFNNLLSLILKYYFSYLNIMFV